MIRSKPGRPREIPIASSFRRVLEALGPQGAGRAFKISDTTLRRHFPKALRTAGIEDFRFHDLRHTFASRLVMSGVDLYTVQRLLGYSSIMMTERYAHLSPSYLKAAIQRLEEGYIPDTSLRAPAALPGTGESAVKT